MNVPHVELNEALSLDFSADEWEALQLTRSMAIYLATLACLAVLEGIPEALEEWSRVVQESEDE